MMTSHLIHGVTLAIVEVDRDQTGWLLDRADGASSGEEFMSNLKYAIVENDANATDTLEQAPDQQARPYLVSNGSASMAVSITRRAEQALDLGLAQGSMPA
jgi:hypothetical protein